MIKSIYKPIQIIGTQRSGSNLLRLMLNELDGVVAPHPPHILKTFTPLLPLYGNLNVKENFMLLIADVRRLIETNPVVWDGLILDDQRIYDRCESRNLIEIFRVVYEMMAETNKSTHWCCKSMSNVRLADELEQSGLKPYYIRLIRDGRDVAASFKKVAVGDKHVYHLAHYWKELQELSKQLVDKIGPERAITITYEDLIHHPVQTMKEICSFLNLNYTPKVLRFFNSTESLHTSESGFMWQNLRKPILKNNTGKFRQVLTNEEIKIFEQVAIDVLKANNYVAETSVDPLQFTTYDIERFDRENERLKQETLQCEHLRVDLMKREAQEKFIESIKARKIVLNAAI